MSATQTFVPLNPRPFLQNLINTHITLRLKWGPRTEYTGTLKSVDSYMNVQLDDTVEWEDGKESGRLGSVLIRCNNVLWMGPREDVVGLNGAGAAAAAVGVEKMET